MRVMKAAFSVWNQRIAPVFDVSRRVVVVEVQAGEVVDRRDLEFDECDPFFKLERLAELRVQALVCGAISRPLAEVAVHLGMELFPFIAGDLEEVMTAYLKGGLQSPALAMPGCRRRARMMGGRPRGSTGIANRRYDMPNQDGTGPAGKGPGTGKGMGRGGQGSKPGARKGQGRGQGKGRGMGRNN